jgi:hypothetical protein
MELENLERFFNNATHATIRSMQENFGTDVVIQTEKENGKYAKKAFFRRKMPGKLDPYCKHAEIAWMAIGLCDNPKDHLLGNDTQIANLYDFNYQSRQLVSLGRFPMVFKIYGIHSGICFYPETNSLHIVSEPPNGLFFSTNPRSVDLNPFPYISRLRRITQTGNHFICRPLDTNNISTEAIKNLINLLGNS